MLLLRNEVNHNGSNSNSCIPCVGLPAIGVVWAIGITGTVAMLTHRGASTNSEDNAQEQIVYNVLKAFITPLVCVGIGWLVHMFM